MRVVMKHVSGKAEANLERAKHEMERVLSFRGEVVGSKVEGSKIILEIKINPKWDLPNEEKVDSLKEWITAKVRTSFKVVSVSVKE